MYLEVHLPELLAPLDKECGAHVQVELGESICPLSLPNYDQSRTSYERDELTKYVSHMRIVF